MSVAFIRGGTLFAAFFIILSGSMLFTGLGGSSGSGDKNTSSACSAGFFATNATETGGTLVLVCSQVGWTQLTGFPSGCSAGQFVISIGAILTCGTPSGDSASSVKCTTGQYVTNVTE